MADGIARILSKQGFDPDNFVKKVSDGGEVGLRDVQTQVQTLAEETSLALKRNVYKNYSQFIETAKEISILEGEMYQLSHMLTDQKNILHSMMEMSITEERVEGPGPVESDQAQPQEEEKLQNLAFLLEKVEGCSSVTEVPGRHLIHNGDLVELDPESFTPLQKVHIFLMNDSLMIATWLQNRRGPVKYAFQSLYELDNLAVVNARDVGQCKNAFKILMFPDTRMYQAESPKAKRQWLDILEDTKKKKLAVDSHRRESAAVASLGLKAHRESIISWDDNNPFSEFDDDEESTPATTPQDPPIEQDLLHVDWLQELPEDLDVCVAQRDFEGAVNLIEKVNEHLNNSPKSAATKEYRARIDQRIKQLTEVLVGELQVAPERSIRGGPRAARRAVTQLIRLGKSSQACRLFLQNRSAITKYNIRQLKIEGATTLYMKKLSEVFFTNLHQTGREFIKAFPEHFTCYSFFVVWAKNELRGFMSIFRKQVFETKVTFTTVAECVHQAVESCHKLTEMGLDLSSTLTNIILKDLEKMIEETKEVQLDAIRRRGQEDLWRPVNHKSEEGIERFEAEMESLGFEFINTYTFDDCFTALTSNTIHFTRSYLGFCTDLLHVYCQELHYLVSSGLAAVMEAQLRHVQRASLKKDFQDQKMFIERNGAFLVTTLLPLVEHRVMYRTGQSCQPLEDLRTKYRTLKRITTQISSVENGEEYV